MDLETPRVVVEIDLDDEGAAQVRDLVHRRERFPKSLQFRYLAVHNQSISR